jgi:hypothetical protein
MLILDERIRNIIFLLILDRLVYNKAIFFLGT